MKRYWILGAAFGALMAAGAAVLRLSRSHRK